MKNILSNKIFLIGAITSLLISGSMYLFNQGKDGALHSFQVGLMGLVISLTSSLIDRVDKAIEENKRVSKIASKIDSTPKTRERLEEIINRIHNIFHKSDHTFITNSTEFEIEQFLEKLKDLSRGRYFSNHDDDLRLIELSENAQTFMQAISIGNVKTDFAWWFSPEGRQYWGRNVKFLEKGKRIERILIYEKATDNFNKVVMEQHQAGVKLFLVKSQHTSPGQRLSAVIMDENVLYQQVLGNHEDIIKRFFSTNKSDIKEAKERFEKLKLRSEPEILEQIIST